MPRIQKSFSGTKVIKASFEPEEFRGMTLPEITEEVLAVLKEIEPDVDFFGADAVDAACDIYDAIPVEECGDCGAEVIGAHGHCPAAEEHGGES